MAEAPLEVAAGLNLEEYQELARGRLPPSHYDYIAGGSGDENTLRGNREAFQRWRIVPRMLRGVDAVDLSVTVLDEQVSMPILCSPVSFQRLCCPDGEIASAAAAKRAGTIFSLSTLATRTIEEVAEYAGAWWFQLYCYSDRSVTLDLVQRAEAAGAGAIIITVDMPIAGRREADERNSFALPEGVEVANLLQYLYRRLPETGGSGLAAYISSLWNPALSWDDVDWIAGRTRLPIGIKGLLAAEDARLAVEHGAKMVVVSNHGGRQLDQCIATVDALPSIVEAVGKQCEVLLDGGVRRGTDVMKALILGAKAVMIGRPYVWGLACDGEAGALRVLEMLRAELQLDMHLAGCGSLKDLSGIHLRQVS